MMQGRFAVLPSKFHIDCVPHITNMHYVSLHSQWKFLEGYFNSKVEMKKLIFNLYFFKFI